MVKEKDIHLLYYVCIVLNWQIARLKNEKKWKEHFVKINTIYQCNIRKSHPQLILKLKF